MKQNIGAGDKKIRLILGFIAIYLFFFLDKQGVGAYIALVAGIVLVVTSIIGFCPIYALLGINTNALAKINLSNELKNGGVIIDVRTPQEYAGGHIADSLNIPLNNISGRRDELNKKYKTIITCCASGMRSASAKLILSGTSTKVINGGSWQSLQHQINKK